MTLPQLPQDKANHFIYGLLIFGVVGLYSPLAGLIAAVVAAAAKEASDAYINYRATGSVFKGPHGFELWDFLATSAGGASGFYCTYL
jgi:hypothetical protein